MHDWSCWFTLSGTVVVCVLQTLKSGVKVLSSLHPNVETLSYEAVHNLLSQVVPILSIYIHIFQFSGVLCICAAQWMGTLTHRICIWCAYFRFFLQWSPSRGMTQRSPATSLPSLATRLEWHTLCVRSRSLAPVSSIIVIGCNVYSMFSIEETITVAFVANINRQQQD